MPAPIFGAIRRSLSFRRWGLPPVTGAIIAANLVCFLGSFFSQRDIWFWLHLEPERVGERPWTLLTFPFDTPYSLIWLALTLYVFYWVGSSLEREWGSAEFALFFAGVTLLTASAALAANAALGSADALYGLGQPLAAAFVAWCMLHPRATVQFMLVIPVPALYLGYLGLALAYFGNGPLAGLFFLAPPLAAWWYAARGRSFRRVRFWWRDLAARFAAKGTRPRRPWTQRLNPWRWYRRRARQEGPARLHVVQKLKPDRDEDTTVH